MQPRRPGIRRRPTWALLALWAAFAACATEPPTAWAHGGPVVVPPPPPTPEPPKPPVPPQLPEAPPPPVATPRPPALTAPPPGTPGTPAPGAPPGPAETPPPALTPPGAPSPGGPVPRTTPGAGGSLPGRPARPTLPGRGREPTRVADEATWEAWWLLQRPLFLPDREEARRRQVFTSAGGPADVGPAGSGARDGTGTLRASLAERVALPLLRSLAAPTNDAADLRASALLAWARLSTSEETRAALAAALASPHTPELVRESAALAFGLLRRSDPAQQLPPADLDELRQALLEAVDDRRAPTRTRAFAAFALGLLGDQPFAGPPGERAGALAAALWSRVGRHEASHELPVALLNALSLQPGPALPEHVRLGLRAAVLGRDPLPRRLDPVERAHALTALARLVPADAAEDVLRTLDRRRAPRELTRAAALAAGAHAGAWDGARRARALTLVLAAIEAASDPLTEGLLRLALGRVLAADLRAGSSALSITGVRALSDAATTAQPQQRGFALLGLALAGQAAAEAAAPAGPAAAADGGGGDPPAWARQAVALCLEGLERRSEDDGLRAAHAVALGLLGQARAVGGLAQAVGDRAVGERTRSHGAVALGQLGLVRPEVVRTLVIALLDRRAEALRGEAALALSWLGAREALPLLLREIDEPRAPEHVRARVSLALGRLGALGAVEALAATARDGRHGEESRALAVAALGLVLDPEPRSSLLRLARDVNYPARTAALHEVLTIL